MEVRILSRKAVKGSEKGILNSANEQGQGILPQRRRDAEQVNSIAKTNQSTPGKNIHILKRRGC